MADSSRSIKSSSSDSGSSGGQPYLVPRRSKADPPQKFLISQQPRRNKRCDVQGVQTLFQKMLKLKTKTRDSQRKEKAQDMSILASIQRYRKPNVMRLLGGSSAMSSSSSSSASIASSASSIGSPSEGKENSGRFHPYWKRSSSGMSEDAGGHVRLASVPHLVTSSQTRLSLGMTRTSVTAPPESQKASETPPKPYGALVSYNGFRPLQSPWARRDSEDIRGQSLSGKLIPDPKVTRQMSIQDLVQIMSGNALPPKGFFIGESDDESSVSAGSRVGMNNNTPSLFGGSVDQPPPGNRRRFQGEQSSSDFTINLTAPFEVDIIPPDSSFTSTQSSVYF